MKPKPQKSLKDFFFLHVGLSQQDFGSRTCLSSLFFNSKYLDTHIHFTTLFESSLLIVNLAVYHFLAYFDVGFVS